MAAWCSWQGNGRLDGMQPAKISAAFSELISVELNVPRPPECLYLWCVRQLGSKLVPGCTSPASTTLLAPLRLWKTGLVMEVGCTWLQDGEAES